MIEHHKKQNRLWAWLCRIFWVFGNSAGDIIFIPLLLLALFGLFALSTSKYVDTRNDLDVLQEELLQCQIDPNTSCSKKSNSSEQNIGKKEALNYDPK